MEILRKKNETFSILGHNSFLGLFNLSMNAQQASRINGTIVDENLFPIENANIILVGTRLGTVSGKMGNFQL